MPHGEADEQAFRDASWLVAEATITRIGGNAERVARSRPGEKTMDEGRVRIKGREFGIEDLAHYVFDPEFCRSVDRHWSEAIVRPCSRCPGTMSRRQLSSPSSGRSPPYSSCSC